MNQVVAGEYKGAMVVGNKIVLGLKNKVVLNSETVETFEEMDRVEKRSAGKTIVGGAMLGRTGALLGATSKKVTLNCKVVFKDGKKSLLKIDHTTYEAIQRAMFDDADSQPAKMSPKMKKILIITAVVVVLLSMAAAAGNKTLKEKEEKALKECTAIEQLQDDSIEEKTGSKVPKTKAARREMCENMLNQVGRDQFLKDIEAGKSDNKDLTANGHNLDWYIEHIDD